MSKKRKKGGNFSPTKPKKEAEAAAAAQAELEAIAKREREAEKKKAQKQKQNQQKQQKEITAFEKEFQELLEAQKQMEATFNNGGKVDDDDEDIIDMTKIKPPEGGINLQMDAYNAEVEAEKQAAKEQQKLQQNSNNAFNSASSSQIAGGVGQQQQNQ